METATFVESRRSARTELTWPVSLWLPEANRFFNANSVNISKGGVLLSAPMTTPVRKGHSIEINFPRTMALAREKGCFARIKSGKVVRVDRKNMLVDGTITIAVQFDG
ncbi:MAG: PilZ domain-containing protein [Planctomycetota bacterium]